MLIERCSSVIISLPARGKLFKELAFAKSRSPVGAVCYSMLEYISLIKGHIKCPQQVKILITKRFLSMMDFLVMDIFYNPIPMIFPILSD